MTLLTTRVVIKGKVQEVFFRKYTVEAALKHGITGFVMNLDDGAVYVEATGSQSDLKAFTDWCFIGSPQSKVETVLIESLECRHYTGFEIRY